MTTYYILFNKNTFLPDTIIDLSTFEGEISGGFEIESDENITTIINTYHLNGSTIEKHSSATSRWDIWDVDLLLYVFNLRKCIEFHISTINQLASQKILPKYPIYLQLNLPYDFGQDSVEVETMRTWIDSVRTLANTAKAEIALATTLPEITTIVDTFKQELAEIS